MKLTSAEANKLLRKYAEERGALLEKEELGRVFVAATVENKEDARPDYRYEETRAALREIEEKIRRVKHAVNLFNVTHTLPQSGLTIDEALVRIPQLSEEKRRLSAMRLIPEKQRAVSMRGTNLIEYTYANFSPADAERDFNAVADELSRLQNELDLFNSTAAFEIAL